MKGFAKETPETRDLLTQVIEAHHPELELAGVKVGVVMVLAESGEVALTVGGHAADAKVGLLTDPERVHAKIDCRVQIDAQRWANLNDKQRTALLDHEMTHVEPVIKNEQFVKHADGRPKLRLRKDDWCMTGFVAIVKRHGSNAPESRSMKALYDLHGQSLFGFMGRKR